MTRPLADLRGPIRALFSDVDGTMTTGERIDFHALRWQCATQADSAGISPASTRGPGTTRRWS